MSLDEILRRTTESASVRRVFGEPITVGDDVVIPVARVMGGGGGGTGDSELGQGGGGGSGFRASPVGAFHVRDGEMTWNPALDVGRIVLGGQVLAAVIAVVLAVALRRRDR